MSETTASDDDLQKEVHDALLLQHPEWVEVDGASPILDLYGERFAKLLHLFKPRSRRRPSAKEGGLHDPS